jgi:hypothetical protein
MKMISINTVTHKDKKHTAILSKLPGRGKKSPYQLWKVIYSER